MGNDIIRDYKTTITISHFKTVPVCITVSRWIMYFGYQSHTGIIYTISIMFIFIKIIRITCKIMGIVNINIPVICTILTPKKYRTVSSILEIISCTIFCISYKIKMCDNLFIISVNKNLFSNWFISSKSWRNSTNDKFPSQ